MQKLTLLILLICCTAYPQKRIEPDTADKTLATQLKEKFEDAHVGIEQSADYFSFGFNRKSNVVTVDQTLEESLINLDHRADIQKFIFYNDQIEVKKFEVRYKNQKTAYFPTFDEAYTSEDLFHNDTRVKYMNIDFPLNAYKYLSEINTHYKDIKYFTKVYFNSFYPAAKRTITFEIPNWLEVELKELNFDGYEIKRTEGTNRKGDAKVISYSMQDVPAMYNEENSPGPTYIYPHILVLAKSHSYNGSSEPIFSTTQDLYNWYHSLVSSLENDTSGLEDKVAELTEDAKNDEEKIKTIFYWVQDNIRYIAFEDGIAGFKPDEASNVYKKRYGDCKGMANLMKQMLKIAGFDARLAWIGTKRIAYDYSTPNLSVDNHMICAVYQGDEVTFLDGTEKFNAYLEYADRIQGKQVLIEDGTNFILEEIPVGSSSKNKEIHTYELQVEENALVGKARKIYNGESRTAILYFLNSMKTDAKDTFVEDFLESSNDNISVSDISSSDINNREISLQFDYDITVDNAVASFGDETYIDLDIEKEFANFQMEERDTDFIFNFKQELESTIILNVSDQYEITYVPENISIEKDNFDLQVTFDKSDNVISYKKHFIMKNAKIAKDEFESWNAFISKLNNTYKDQIVLTRK